MNHTAKSSASQKSASTRIKKNILCVSALVLPIVAMMAVIALADSIHLLPEVSWATTSVTVAVASLAAMLVRAYRKKKYGIVDTVMGIAYLTFAVKFCQLVWGLSLMAAVGAGMAVLMLAYLGYVAFLFIYVR